MRVDHVDGCWREMRSRGERMAHNLAEAAGDVYGDNRGRSLLERRPIGMIKVFGRGRLRVGSPFRMRQACIELRCGDVDAVAVEAAIQADAIRHHEDADGARMARKNIGGTVGDYANSRGRLMPR